MKTGLERGKKKMKNKKGFTLIELLAVIVILAIIALIAVPVVMNIISKANKSAFKDSAYGVIKAGENFYMNELLKPEGVIDDAVFIFPNEIEGLEINGSKPTGGTMIINKDGKVSIAITNGRHCVTKGFNDDDITISDDVNNCEIKETGKTLSELVYRENDGQITFTSVDGITSSTVSIPDCIAKGSICSNGANGTEPTAVAIRVNDTETYKFYVMKDDGKEVTLIMDRNLYSAEDLANNTHNVAWINASDYGNTTVKNDKGPLTALTTLKERTKTWTNLPRLTIKTYDDETNAIKNLPNSFIMYARLPKYSEVAEFMTSTDTGTDDYGATTQSYGSDTTTDNYGDTSGSTTLPAYLTDNLFEKGDNNTYGYWTSAAYAYSLDSHIAWVIYCHGDVRSSIMTNAINYGLRPVITLSK